MIGLLLAALVLWFAFELYSINKRVADVNDVAMKLNDKKKRKDPQAKQIPRLPDDIVTLASWVPSVINDRINPPAGTFTPQTDLVMRYSTLLELERRVPNMWTQLNDR